MALHGSQHRLGVGAEEAHVEAGLESEAGAHGRQRGVPGGARLVAGRPHVGPVRALGRDADGVVDQPGRHLVPPHQAGEDGQAGGVGRGPPGRAQGVGTQVPDRPRPGGRAGGAVGRGEQLVEHAGVPVDHQGVAVAAALHRRVRRQGVGAGVALVGVLEGHRQLGLAPGHHDVGDPVGLLACAGRAEVRVESAVRAAHGGQPGGTGRVHGQGRHVGVPHVVGREHRAARPGRRERARRSGSSQPGNDEDEEDPPHGVASAEQARRYSRCHAGRCRRRRPPRMGPRRRSN